MMTDFVSRVPKVPPVWWGAVAGAAAAGAAIFPQQRILAALVGGGAMLALAVKVATPCCDECAGSTNNKPCCAECAGSSPRSSEGIAVGEPAPVLHGGLDEVPGSTGDPAKLLANAAIVRTSGATGASSRATGGTCAGCS